MYFPYDILLYIYNNITNIKDKINFCKINRELYNNNITNIKNTIKLEITDYIYKDYIKFFKFLKYFDYEQYQISNFITHTLTNMRSHTIWTSKTCGTYDVRYIFELMCLDEIRNKDVYKIQDNFYRHFYPILTDNIITNDRKNSKLNIVKNNFFTIFQSNFKPCPKNYESSKYINLF
tara:strand:+ start:28 stop:558 length:531 start_codon:yes stop_codon:yes gene_type:complete